MKTVMIPCPQCRRLAVVTSTDRKVTELELEDLEDMSEGQEADYEAETLAGGGDNWTELVETATCSHCKLTIVRRTLNDVETVAVSKPAAAATKKKTPLGSSTS